MFMKSLHHCASLKRDPIKWLPLFGKIARKYKILEQMPEFIKTHLALERDPIKWLPLFGKIARKYKILEQMRDFSKTRLALAFLIIGLSFFAPAVYAEGGAPDSGHKVVDKPKPRYRAKLKMAPSMPAKTPDAPVPYVTPTMPGVQAQAQDPHMPPPTAQASSVYDLPSKDVSPPLVSQGPLPVPISPQAPLVADLPPPVANSHTIILKCDTVVFAGSKARSSGSFYIGLFPLELNPDEWADYRVYRVDPQHETLLRRSACLDKTCTAQVNATAYFLINQSDKKTTLRITLDRLSGTYLAEYTTRSLGGLSESERYEKGSCQRAALAQPKF